MSTLSTYFSRLAAAAILLSACTDRGDTSETGSTSATTDLDPTGTASTGTASTGTPTTGDNTTDNPLSGEHGFTCVSFGVGENTDTDPLEGTRKVKITLNYEPCLADFYRNKHPELRQDAPPGAALFADWKTRLCSEPVDALTPCEVESFVQTIPDSDSETASMTITYAIPADAGLLGRKLLWGPGPLPELAACEGGLQPTVALRSVADIIGLDDKDQQIWRVESFGASKGLIGTTGEGCIQVFTGYLF